MPPNTELFIPELCLHPIQPLLKRILKNVIRDHPSIFSRLGAYKSFSYLIDVRQLPFLLLLQPDPSHPKLRALSRRPVPVGDARITGSFGQLTKMVSGEMDGDALFFSRDIEITGNLEAVVCLAKAMDDIDTSIMDSVWRSLGRPGSFIGRRARAFSRRRLGMRLSA